MKIRKNLSRLVIIGVLLLVGVIVIISTQDKSAKKKLPPLIPDSSRLESSIPVIGTILKPQQFNEIVSGVGVLEGWNRSLISSEAGGRLIAWNQPIGVMLDSGEIFCLFDDELPKIQLQQAAAALQSAQVTVQKTDRDLSRLRELHQSGILSRGELEKAELALKGAQAALAGAEAAAALARRVLDHTALKMPFTGVVARRLVSVGQTIAPGMPVAEVVQMNPIRLTLALSADAAVQLKRGQMAIVGLQQTHKTINGKVYSVGRAADPISRLFPIEISLTNPDGSLSPGLTADVEIITRVHPAAIVVPASSIITTEFGSTGYKVGDGRAIAVSLTILARRGGDAMIEGRLEPGDTLIITGIQALKDGQRVTVSLNPD